MNSNTAPLSLSIDRLILHGFTTVDRDQLQLALQQELARLFSEHGCPPTLSQTQQIGRLEGGHLQIAADASSSAIGQHIAQSIYQGLQP
ncbi:hypothetical protein [Almyronema epifaneia]|uniref:Uncharacterized protein n=1 Tax=Almyronema epifaneia S1 TaxID=2991925 RepID=A0ABW6IFJ4_9CYAN